MPKIYQSMLKEYPEGGGDVNREALKPVIEFYKDKAQLKSDAPIWEKNMTLEEFIKSLAGSVTPEALLELFTSGIEKKGTKLIVNSIGTGVSDDTWTYSKITNGLGAKQDKLDSSDSIKIEGKTANVDLANVHYTATHANLTTTNKTIVGAINEVNNKISTLAKLLNVQLVV